MHQNDVRQFITAGHSIFTLYNSETDKRYTYKITNGDKMPERLFARVLYGPDNETDYQYMGLFYSDTLVLKTSTAAQIAPVAPQFRLLEKFLTILRGDCPWPDSIKFYPSGKCGRCGRTITTPESIERGIGPECYNRL